MISKNQQKYLEEYEKYKHIEIVTGSYCVKGKEYLIYEILGIDLVNETALLRRGETVSTRTLHWCRKKLSRREQ